MGMKNGRGEATTSPPIYLLDSIEVSSMLKEGIFRKAAALYESGQSLNEISQALEVPRSSLRDALVRSGVDLRPQGKWQNGHVRGVPPYGYAVVAGKLVENPKEQQIVQRVLTQWRSGKSFNAIAKTLNGQGVRTRSGKSWEHSIIRSIVQRNKSN